MRARPTHRVYLASPAGLALSPTRLVAKRIMLAGPAARCVACPLAAPYPVSVSPGAATLPKACYFYLLALGLTDALGYLLGIDLVAIAEFLDDPHLASLK